MRNLHKFSLIILFLVTKISFADDNMFGFALNGEPINPKCVELLQPWISDYGIIIRSIVVDTCQESNLAFEGKYNINISNDGTVGYYEDPQDGHTYFGYKVLGLTANNIYVVQHMGKLGFYRIQNSKIRHNWIDEDEDSKVLTKLSGDDSFCFVSAQIDGNIVKINRLEQESKWCGSKEYTTTYDLSNL